MKPRHKVLLPIPVAIALALPACGGGSGGPIAPSARPPPLSSSCGAHILEATGPEGIEGTGFTKLRGIVDGIQEDGSILIGCYLVTTDGTSVYVDGQPGTLADVSVHAVVVAVGSFDSGSYNGHADRIDVCADPSCQLTNLVRSGSFNQTKSAWSFGWNGSLGSVTVDGDTAAAAALEEGDVALFHGRELVRGGVLINDADATDVQQVVIGTVDAVDSTDLSLTVLGQPVFTAGNSCTAEPGTPELMRSLLGLHPGDPVAISGHAAPGGGVFATHIGAAPGPASFVVSGFVSASDAAGTRFALNGLSIDYGGAELRGFPSGAPADGDRVVARSAAAPVAGFMTATRVDYRPPAIGGSAGTSAWVEGLITRWAAPGDFDVDGYRVRLHSDGSCGAPTPPDLHVNDWVILGGARLDSEGVITDTADPAGAACIVRIQPREITLTGPVDAIDAGRGTLSVLGYLVKASPVTRWHDGASASALNVGDVVEVSGLAGPLPGQLVASGIGAVASGAATEPAIDARAYTLASGIVQIAGSDIRTDGGTVFRNVTQRAFPRAMSAAGFFNGRWQGGRCYKRPLYAGTVHLTLAHDTQGWLATHVDADGTPYPEGCPDDEPPPDITALCASRER